MKIRSARPEDCAAIHVLICELAEYEKLRREVVSSPALLRDALFGDSPCAGCIVAETDAGETSAAPPLAGFALFFTTFSTFVGRPGLYLEDLYVRPAHRRAGIGKMLLREVAAVARRRNCGRLEWSVLDWNEPAIQFYESLGAELKREWILNRLDEPGIARLAEADAAP